MQPAQSLPDLIAGAGIRLKRFTPGHNEHVRCPRCEGGRDKEPSLSVTIDADGAGAAWICHRATCGWTDGARVLTGDRPETRERPIQRPAEHPATVRENRPDWLHEFFAERRIGAHTLAAFGIYAVRRKFEGLGERPTMVFPYLLKGEVANRKYRPHPEKQPQQQERDALQTLFNVDLLGDAPAEIVWVEGEPDVLAMFECGIPHAVTLKDGAPAEANSKNEKRFEALRTHAEVLAKAKRIILAGDNDKPGLALREELARRLGRHRCSLVTWPTGCKDACDTLREHGPDAVVAAVRAAEPYPIDGLQRITAATLLGLRARPAPTTMTTGARGTDAVLRLPTEGRLIVVTGWPNHGKSVWLRFVMVHTATDHARHWVVFSPEMQPWEQFAADCAVVYSGKLFWPRAGLESMTDIEAAEAGAWLGDRVTMMVSGAEGDAPTLDWVLERAAAAVLRDGATDFVLDPWNELSHARGTMSETDYIGLSLQRIRTFGEHYGCNTWVVAHPAKPPPLKPGEKRGFPGPYDLSGSANWANKADLGITVHSPEAGVAQIHIWKSRHQRWGRRSTVGVLEYDQLTGRYSTPLAAAPASDPVERGHWQESEG